MSCQFQVCIKGPDDRQLLSDRRRLELAEQLVAPGNDVRRSDFPEIAPDKDLELPEGDCVHRPSIRRDGAKQEFPFGVFHKRWFWLHVRDHIMEGLFTKRGIIVNSGEQFHASFHAAALYPAWDAFLSRRTQTLRLSVRINMNFDVGMQS